MENYERIFISSKLEAELPERIIFELESQTYKGEYIQFKRLYENYEFVIIDNNKEYKVSPLSEPEIFNILIKKYDLCNIFRKQKSNLIKNLDNDGDR